jgi:hypothetical protein
MSDLGKHKLSDAIPKPPKGRGKKRGKPVPGAGTVAETARETAESEKAREAQASNRERMVDIGRGNQQAGRHGS